MAAPLEERRRFPRVNLCTPMRYQIRGEPSYDNAVCDNISLGGMGFISSKFIPPETPLMLELNVLCRILRPIGRIIRSSSIPHSNRSQIGVEFLELDPNEKNFLSDYIDMRIVQL